VHQCCRVLCLSHLTRPSSSPLSHKKAGQFFCAGQNPGWVKGTALPSLMPAGPLLAQASTAAPLPGPADIPGYPHVIQVPVKYPKLRDEALQRPKPVTPQSRVLLAQTNQNPSLAHAEPEHTQRQEGCSVSPGPHQTVPSAVDKHATALDIRVGGEGCRRPPCAAFPMLLRCTWADSNLSAFQGDSSDKLEHLQQRKRETGGPEEE